MSGVGRGRAWLNLKGPNAPAVGPGSQGSPSPTSSPPPNSFQSLSPDQFSDVINDYLGIVNKIKQLNFADDGIKFNQKIKHIVESWSEDCKSSQQVVECFDIIHETCLADSDLATKLVLLIASRTFLNQTIQDNNIRLMFLKKLQQNYEACVKMKNDTPNAFRNSALMMGEFYNKARMANGQPFTFMAEAVCSYMDMLLESAKPADLKLFARQLYLNGASLKFEEPEKLSNTLNKARLVLCTDKNLTKDCKLWLLLALEVAANRFTLLPAEIQTFYHNNLGEANMASFQGTPTVLSVQTHQGSKKMDSFQSNVSVLQVSESPNSSFEPTSPSNTNVTDTSLTSVNNCTSSGFHSDSSDNNSHINNIVKDLKNKMKNPNQQSNNQHQLNKSNQKQQPQSQPTGRPILGIGARLQRNRINPDILPPENDNSMPNNFESSWQDSRDRVSKDRGTEADSNPDDRGHQDSKERRESIEHRDSREYRENKNHRDPNERKDGRGHIDTRGDNKGNRENRRDSRGERREQRGDTRDGKRDGNREGNRDGNREGNKDGNWRNHGNQNQGKKSGGADWGNKNQHQQRKSGGNDRGDKKKNFPPKESGKSWGQHDDRFENDYS